MLLRHRLQNYAHTTLSFSVVSTTTVTVIVYLAIIIASIVQYEVLPTPPKPSKQIGLDLAKAMQDLQIIAGSPHPHNSHANDIVRAHLLARVRSAAKGKHNVHIFDDSHSNATWASSSATGVYYEGNNILVKIDGRQPKLDAVLFSAHFDSVSTAPGATDDGMGVATVLQLVDYFSKHTPKRTVVFNINNGEEDGLHGAHVFLEHPWASLPKSFLNLEGAGSGGRPALFRTSSLQVTKAFADVTHPFGSVLSSDQFSKGVIRSSTDYSVYEKNGLKGLDLAFCARRSLYHTKADSVPNLDGAASLWMMMSSALKAGISLSENIQVKDNDDKAVYFDIFGEALVIIPMKVVFIINVILLVVGPLLVAAVMAIIYTRKQLHWSLKGWLRFPLSVILGLGLPTGLAYLYTYVNPYIVYSSSHLVALTFLAIAFISVHVPLLLLAEFRPVSQQKSIILVEYYVLWWIALVYYTVMVNNHHLGGLYAISFFHIASFLALVLTLSEHLLLPPQLDLHYAEPVDHDPSRGDEDGEHNQVHTEQTPLLGRRRTIARPDIQESEHYGFWLAEYLLLVPFPITLVCGIYMTVLIALPQTLADGSPALNVYLLLAALSFWLILPLAPFAHRVHRYASLTFFIIFVIMAVYTLLAFPFSGSSPSKVFFQQKVDLVSGKNRVSLTGLPGYLGDQILPTIPSTWNQSIECRAMGDRVGLTTCSWEGLPPSVASHNPKSRISYNVSLVAPGTALIKLRGQNTRACRIYFDKPVASVRVKNTTGEVQKSYPFPQDGIRQLRLWSRAWDKEFVVTANWVGEESLSGRLGCGWAESQEIAAFNEVSGFLPSWAIVTKQDDALLEATATFRV